MFPVVLSSVVPVVELLEEDVLLVVPVIVMSVVTVVEPLEEDVLPVVPVVVVSVVPVVKMWQCQWEWSYGVYVSMCQSYYRKCVNDHEAGPNLTKTLLSKVINLLLGSEESSERSWPVAGGCHN